MKNKNSELIKQLETNPQILSLVASHQDLIKKMTCLLRSPTPRKTCSFQEKIRSFFDLMCYQQDERTVQPQDKKRILQRISSIKISLHTILQDQGIALAEYEYDEIPDMTSFI